MEILPQKDGEFAKKFDNWPTKFPEKPDNGKWKEYFKWKFEGKDGWAQ